jgi:RNA polymerase sigma-70 factor (ECF subfamily)
MTASITLINVPDLDPAAGSSQGLAELLRRISRREEQALAELCDLTRCRLKRFVMKIVDDEGHAEDVVQDVYRQVWAKAGSYDPARGAPLAWLMMIARSRGLDQVRRNRQSSLDAPIEDLERLTTTAEAELELDKKILTDRIRRVVISLPEQQREVIDLAFYDGYSHSEIADETGLPLGTVKTRIRSALMRIREVFKEAELGRKIASDAFYCS